MQTVDNVIPLVMNDLDAEALLAAAEAADAVIASLDAAADSGLLPPEATDLRHRLRALLARLEPPRRAAEQQCREALADGRRRVDLRVDIVEADLNALVELVTSLEHVDELAIRGQIDGPPSELAVAAWLKVTVAHAVEAAAKAGSP